MSNDSPPRACLADFGFMTMVLDANHPMSCSAQLEGGTLMFMSPELLLPPKFGLKISQPSPQSDVYAFGLVIFQVRRNGYGRWPPAHVAQVLTGEVPFRDHGAMGYVFSVVDGHRPVKPENAATIGFSDSLWDFVQRCWDAKAESRPEAAEVVSHLAKATSEWNKDMPPCVQPENVPANLQEPVSDSMKYRELEV